MMTEHGSGNGRRYGSTTAQKFSRKQPVSWPRRAWPYACICRVVFQPIMPSSVIAANVEKLILIGPSISTRAGQPERA